MKAINRIADLGEGKKQIAEQWKLVLGSPEVEMVRTNAVFLHCLGDFLGKTQMGIGCYRIINKFLNEVHKELVTGSFGESGTTVDLTAWQVAVNGLKQAVWWMGIVSTIDAFKEIIKSPKLRIVFGVCMLLLFVFTRFNTVILKIGNQLERWGRDNPVILELEVKEETGGIFFGEESVYPRVRDSHWGLWTAEPLPEHLEQWGITTKGEVAACFAIGHNKFADTNIDVVLELEEFALEAGKYKVWQYVEGRYCDMNVIEGRTKNYERDVIYPYEEDGRLYLNVKVADIDGQLIEFSERHPVIIVRTNAIK